MILVVIVALRLFLMLQDVKSLVQSPFIKVPFFDVFLDFYFDIQKKSSTFLAGFYLVSFLPNTARMVKDLSVIDIFENILGKNVSSCSLEVNTVDFLTSRLLC